MPTVTPGGGGRAQYYDRNPLAVANSSNISAGAGARALTTDWTYTVPAGKKAFIEFIRAGVINNSTIAIDASIGALVDYTPSGGSAHRLTVATGATGVSSYESERTSGASGVMLAGDALKGKTVSNNSAAGTSIDLNTAMKATEYDA